LTVDCAVLLPLTVDYTHILPFDPIIYVYVMTLPFLVLFPDDFRKNTSGNPF